MKKVLLCALAACTLLTACSLPGSKKDAEEPAPEPEVATTDVTESYQFTYKSTDKVVYKYNENIPLLSKGKVIAFLQINQLTKLNIQDWTNKLAVKNSVNHSYAINFTITPTEQLEQSGDCIIYADPYLMNSKGKVVGKPAYVGWSGFPESAEFLNGIKHVTIERAMQPTYKLNKGTKIVLKFSSSDGLEIDDVYIAHSIFKKAKHAGGILNASKPVVVKSVSGAKYSIRFDKLEYDSLYSDSTADLNAICFRQRIKYISKPTKKAKVLRFDMKKGYMYTKQDMKIQTNGFNEVLGNKLTDAQRHLYLNSDEYEYFTTEMDEVVNFGRTESSIQAWEIPTVAQSPKYVRFYLEFPEESQALHTTREILNLKTRYLVVQGKVKKHRVPSYTEYVNKEGAL